MFLSTDYGKLCQYVFRTMFTDADTDTDNLNTRSPNFLFGAPVMNLNKKYL